MWKSSLGLLINPRVVFTLTRQRGSSTTFSSWLTLIVWTSNIFHTSAPTFSLLPQWWPRKFWTKKAGGPTWWWQAEQPRLGRRRLCGKWWGRSGWCTSPRGISAPAASPGLGRCVPQCVWSCSAASLGHPCQAQWKYSVMTSVAGAESRGAKIKWPPGAEITNCGSESFLIYHRLEEFYRKNHSCWRSFCKMLQF
jgi:hypothetical protein